MSSLIPYVPRDSAAPNFLRYDVLSKKDPDLRLFSVLNEYVRGGHREQDTSPSISIESLYTLQESHYVDAALPNSGIRAISILNPQSIWCHVTGLSAPVRLQIITAGDRSIFYTVRPFQVQNRDCTEGRTGGAAGILPARQRRSDLHRAVGNPPAPPEDWHDMLLR